MLAAAHVTPLPPMLHLPPDIAQAVLGLLGQSALMVAVLDDQDRHRWVNPRYAEIFDVPLDTRLSWGDMMRRNHARGIGVRIQTADIETWIASATARRGKQPFRAIETDLVDGRWLLITESCQPGGWLLVVGVDVTDIGRGTRELRQARDLALRDARSDALTGLNNRRFVEDCVARLLAGQPKEPAVLAVIDLDHFKRVNDRHGHAAGDAVLVDFARHLLACTRRDDVCARLGGEEFVLLLPRTDVAQAQPVLDRLMHAVRRARPLGTEPTFGYTVSAGLAAAEPGDTLARWLARADIALY
jgi:diguanylate cyclase (GGDEF)-like protein